MTSRCQCRPNCRVTFKYHSRAVTHSTETSTLTLTGALEISETSTESATTSSTESFTTSSTSTTSETETLTSTPMWPGLLPEAFLTARVSCTGVILTAKDIAAYEEIPGLPTPKSRYRYSSPSLVHTALAYVLHEATQSEVFLPFSDFPILSGTVVFDLTIETLPYHQVSSTNTTIQLNTSVEGLAVVDFELPLTQTYAFAGLGLAGPSYLEKCIELPNYFSWAVSPAVPVPSPSTSTWNLPPYSVKAGLNYLFTLLWTVYPAFVGNTTTLPSLIVRSGFPVEVLHGVLTAIIQGGDRSWSNTRVLQLDASFSTDQDDNPALPIVQNDPTRIFTWRFCRLEDSWATTQNFTCSEVQDPILSNSARDLAIFTAVPLIFAKPPVKLPLGPFLFTVTFNRTGRSSAASVVVTFVKGYPPVVLVSRVLLPGQFYSRWSPSIGPLRLTSNISVQCPSDLVGTCALPSTYFYTWSVMLQLGTLMSVVDLTNTTVSPLGNSFPGLKLNPETFALLAPGFVLSATLQVCVVVGLILPLCLALI